MALQYTYLNEISASGGVYTIDNVPPTITLEYNLPSNKNSDRYVEVFVSIYDASGVGPSGISITGPTTGLFNAEIVDAYNFTFFANVTATGSITINATDNAGNSSSLTSTGYVITPVIIPTVDKIPPVITFSNSSHTDKIISNDSIGSVHVRITDNKDMPIVTSAIYLTSESIGQIDNSSITQIDSKTIEFDVINIVKSGYVIVTAKDADGNSSTNSDGFWVAECAGGKKINLTNFLPSHLKESEIFDFIGFFENFLNSMYYDKSGCNISILEKINRLKDFNDINALDSEYFQFFAKHFGYEVDINRDSIGVFSADNDELNIDNYIRYSLKNIPNFNRIKSTEDSINIMLFSFGVVSDVIYLWTNDYDKNWKSESRYNNINVGNEIPRTSPAYYPTPHFRISVNYSQTSPSWVANFNDVVNIINAIKPINTVFSEFVGYFETVRQNPNDPLSFGYYPSVSTFGNTFIPWQGQPARYGNCTP